MQRKSEVREQEMQDGYDKELATLEDTRAQLEEVGRGGGAELGRGGGGGG